MSADVTVKAPDAVHHASWRYSIVELSGHRTPVLEASASMLLTECCPFSSLFGRLVTVLQSHEDGDPKLTMW